MDSANSASPEKKTLGYKERWDTKRAAYRHALAEKRAAGKTIIYTDECGFRAESYRCHEYAPKGDPVFGWVSGKRTRTTTLVAARIGSTFTVSCLFDGETEMLRASMLGLKPTYVHCFVKKMSLFSIIQGSIKRFGPAS